MNTILDSEVLMSCDEIENNRDINEDAKVDVLDVVTLTDAILDEDGIF